MQVILQIIIFIFIFISHAFGHHSFFMNEEQSKTMINLVTNNMNQKQSTNLERPIKLSCVFYLNQENWTIWINNKQYSTIGQNDDFSIDEVNEDSVILTLIDGQTLNLTVSDDIEDNTPHKKVAEKEMYN